jgi:hypothetical protein
MKQMKSLFFTGVITSLTIMMFIGTVYGVSVTVQREGVIQGDQESAVVKDNVMMDDNQLKFAPQRLKNKSDAGMESDAGNQSVRMERYKPYQEGEGESKKR